MSRFSETYKAERMIMPNAIVESWAAQEEGDPTPVGELSIRVRSPQVVMTAGIELSTYEMRALANILQRQAEYMESLAGEVRESA